MDRTQCRIWLTLMGGLMACSSSSPSKVDGSGQLADVPASEDGTGKGGQTGSGGASGPGGIQSDALGGGGAARDSGAGGSGGFGGTSMGGLVDAALGGRLGSGGQSVSGGSGGLGGGLGGGGQLGSGGGTGGVIASGGQAGGQGGSMAGNGGNTIAADAALGGVVGSGGQTVGSGGGGGGGGLGTDAGVSLDVFRGETAYATCGTLTATIGGSATEDSSMQRYAVSGTDCHKYIVQNNNFANPTGSVQTLTISGASFEVVSSTASRASSSNVPASFPSIYIGGNGKIANGTYVTWDDSNLPIRISALGRAMTSFDWSGGVAAGDFAASYDVWFAKAIPVAGAYDDAISGSLMIWLNRPSNRQPAGAVVRQAIVAEHAWDVWVGPHGTTAKGTDDASRPIVSYVAQDGPLHGLAFDLANFITDAVSNGSADMSAARTSQAFSSTWYLTDVIAGFQIWTGSDAAGLQCSGFVCQVK